MSPRLPFVRPLAPATCTNCGAPPDWRKEREALVVALEVATDALDGCDGAKPLSASVLAHVALASVSK